MLQEGKGGPAALPQEQGKWRRKTDGGGGCLKAGQLLLQGGEVGRPCGYHTRDTVSLLSFPVVPGQVCCRHGLFSEQVGELQGQPTPQPDSFLRLPFCVTGLRLVLGGPTR